MTSCSYLICAFTRLSGFYALREEFMGLYTCKYDL
jgi:hypothetical protein